MNSTDSNSHSIVAREVPEQQRMQTLPRHFGRHMLTVQNAIFFFMRKLCARYTGGHWRLFELSNGGFYMAPESESHFPIMVDGNNFDGEMSADAAGITACLFALSHLSFQTEGDAIATHFHLLRDFAIAHPEAQEILAAID
jgi:Antirestriction protein